MISPVPSTSVVVGGQTYTIAFATNTRLLRVTLTGVSVGTDAFLEIAGQRLTAARRTRQDGGHVLDELQLAVERPAGNHIEGHVRISVVDPLPPGAAGDD